MHKALHRDVATDRLEYLPEQNVFYFAIPGMNSGQDSISPNDWTELKRDDIPPPTTKNDWADLITK